MEIENAKRAAQFGEWTEMVQECRNSGQSVRAWCEENEVNIKTYYYRLKRLRLIALGNTESNIVTLPAKAENYPVFAELKFTENDLPETYAANETGVSAVTIRVGHMTINIHNEAGAAVITNVIRAANEVL